MTESGMDGRSTRRGTRKKRRWRANRRTIFKRRLYTEQHGLCALCGRPMHFETSTFDHIIPASDKGPNTQENMQLAHALCNHRRGNRPLAREVAA